MPDQPTTNLQRLATGIEQMARQAPPFPGLGAAIAWLKVAVVVIEDQDRRIKRLEDELFTEKQQAEGRR